MAKVIKKNNRFYLYSLFPDFEFKQGDKIFFETNGFSMYDNKKAKVYFDTDGDAYIEKKLYKQTHIESKVLRQ